MAMIEFPQDSGLPGWAWDGYEYVTTIGVAIAVGSLLAGIIARAIPGCRYNRLHGLIVIGAATLFAGWAGIVALASWEPSDGKFCFAPVHFIVEELPATCVSHWPALLLATPLAISVVLAGTGVALARSRQRRWLALMLVAVAAVASALESDTPLALLQPGVFESGGIISLRDAVVRLALHPLNMGGGLGVALTLVLAIIRQRAADKQASAQSALPQAKAPP